MKTRSTAGDFFRTDTGTRVRIEDIAYHRNGIVGEGFHVVLFRENRDRRVAIVFDGRGRVAVLDRALLADGVIAAGENSWRGDSYEAGLREAIRGWERARMTTARRRA